MLLEPEAGQEEGMEVLFCDRNILYNFTRLLKADYGQVAGERLPPFLYHLWDAENDFNDKEEYRIVGEFLYKEVAPPALIRKKIAAVSEMRWPFFFVNRDSPTPVILIKRRNPLSY